MQFFFFLKSDVGVNQRELDTSDVSRDELQLNKFIHLLTNGPISIVKVHATESEGFEE